MTYNNNIVYHTDDMGITFFSYIYLAGKIFK